MGGAAVGGGDSRGGGASRLELDVGETVGPALLPKTPTLQWLLI